MRTKKYFSIALPERDEMAIQFMQQALETMTLLHLTGVETEGMRGKLNFSREIAGLTEAIGLMGHSK